MLLQEIRERCRVLIYKQMMNPGWGLFAYCLSLLVVGLGHGARTVLRAVPGLVPHVLCMGQELELHPCLPAAPHTAVQGRAAANSGLSCGTQLPERGSELQHSAVGRARASWCAARRK